MKQGRTTNQDLYQVVTEQLKRRKEAKCTLEQYLLQLGQLLSARPVDAPLPTAEFAELLTRALDCREEEADTASCRSIAADEAFPAWQRQLARQVVDLHEMELAGMLSDKYRYFGIDAPSGARWYNFDPHTFVECGLVGTFGGWTPDDDTGREYVPGTVAVVDEHGEVSTAEPEDLDEPMYALETISCEDLEDFLYSGQSYE